MSNEPQFATVNAADPDYEAAVRRARESLPEFRKHCISAPESGAIAFVKAEIQEGSHRAFLWFANARPTGLDFDAEVFEVPAEFPSLSVGDSVVVRIQDVLDWMVNEDGKLHGGFTLRYQRERLNESQRPWFDQQIGVTEYL